MTDSFPTAVYPAATTRSSYGKGAPFSQHGLSCAASIPKSSTGTKLEETAPSAVRLMDKVGNCLPKIFHSVAEKVKSLLKMLCG